MSIIQVLEKFIPYHLLRKTFGDRLMSFALYVEDCGFGDTQFFTFQIGQTHYVLIEIDYADDSFFTSDFLNETLGVAAKKPQRTLKDDELWLYGENGFYYALLDVEY